MRVSTGFEPSGMCGYLYIAPIHNMVAQNCDGSAVYKDCAVVIEVDWVLISFERKLGPGYIRINNSCFLGGCQLVAMSNDIYRYLTLIAWRKQTLERRFESGLCWGRSKPPASHFVSLMM